MDSILWFKSCSYKNKNLVGGKCASLGELHYLARMLNFDIADGFAITTKMYDDFIERNNLQSDIESLLESVDINNLEQLENISNQLINLVSQGSFTHDEETLILKTYNELCELYRTPDLEVAVRSSAIAEDLPNASFAGQQDTFLNVRGHDDLIMFIKKCFASLFNARAISYRKTYKINLEDVKISVAIQKMVRSDIGSAGVAFSIDPETGYDKAIVVNSAYGLGELVVSGGVKPDEIILDKRILRHIDGDPILSKQKGKKQTKIVYDPSGGVSEVNTTNEELNTYSITNSQVISLGRSVLLLEESYSKMFKRN